MSEDSLLFLTVCSNSNDQRQEHVDGCVQYYSKCLYNVQALRIVLHSPVDVSVNFCERIYEPCYLKRLNAFGKSIDPLQPAQSLLK